MDPLTCKFIWHHLKSLIQQNSCILLTTHSADEAENLSTKVAIVTTGGNLKAIGSPQKLLNQYSNDLIIEVKLTVKDSASNLETQNG
jgi:ABC-type multidrug transport system ATPase subunit